MKSDSSSSSRNSTSSLTPRARVVVSLLLGGIALAALLPQASIARLQTQYATANSSKERKQDFVPGEILVRFREDAAMAKAGAPGGLLVVEGQRRILARIDRMPALELVSGLRVARVAPEETLNATRALSARSDVLYAEPNYLWRSNAIPNDPRFPEMYQLKNTGQLSLPPGFDIGAESAWDITTGNDTVVIGVVDTGIDVEHPDLKDNVWRNAAEIPDNGADDDANGYIDDSAGWDFYNDDRTVFDSPTVDEHGTHVAGTIGAVGNNGIGVVGVSWRVKLMPLKFLGAPDGTGPTSDAIAALQYAAMMRDRGVNIRAINNSWGGRSFSQALADAIGELNSRGILFVVAAGNGGFDNDSFPQYPANYDLPNILSVGAEDQRSAPLQFSNFGDQTVDIYAPGFHILSTTPGATYSFFDGTSMATPHVTGTAALVCSARPNISLNQLRNVILFASRINTFRTTKLFTRISLQASGALQSAIENDTVPPGPVTDFRVASKVGRRIDLHWRSSGDDGPGGGDAALTRISFVDSSTGREIQLVTLKPNSPGSLHQESVNMPYQHPSGTIKIVSFDNAGNQSAPTTVDVSVDPIITNAYVQSTTAASPLSTGGQLISNTRGDDLIFSNLGIQIPFRFFDDPASNVSLSTNGALYFFSNYPPATDAFGTIVGLSNYPMIAGLWDDLRTDRRPGDGIYMVTPDPDRVIFRWQGVTYDSPLPGSGSRGENPVSFEIELQRSGDILIRYGEGNMNVRPIVGLSGGAPDPFVVESHSSSSTLINLQNAPTIRFSRPPCTYSVESSSGQSVPSGGGSGRVTVNTGGSCEWTTTTNVNWILISFGSNSIGSRIVSYDVIGNQSVNPRTGTITVAGQTFTVVQDGISCSYQVGTTVQSFSGAGGASGTSVIAPGDCPWTAVSNAPWVTLTSTVSGNGNGGVSFSVAANPTLSPRTTTISVMDKTVTINQAAGNAIDDARNFVRQHYLDFLNREPDTGGWDYWTSGVTQCGMDAWCIHNRRIDVSAAFFIELEFQETGYVVYRMHRAAFGTLPSGPTRANVLFQQFMADRGQLVPGPGLPQSTINFAHAFVQRPEFLQVYPNSLSNAQFVNALFDKANLTPFATERQQEIDAMNNSTNQRTRAQVLLNVIELPAFKTREYNGAFVLMQYFGYLRRDPEQGGYDFWLSVLNNQQLNNYRGMVCAFLTSAEYQHRFGATVTRTDRDCGQ